MSTTNEFQRLNASGSPNITVADTSISASNVPPVPCAGATYARMGAITDTAAAVLTGRFVMFDSVGNVVGVSVVYTFTADGSSLSAGYGNSALPSPYLATPSNDVLLNIGGSYSFIFVVKSITAGNWNLYGRIYFPQNIQ